MTAAGPRKGSSHPCPICGLMSETQGVQLGGHDILHCTNCSHRFAIVVPEDMESYERQYADGLYQESLVRGTLEHLQDDFGTYPTYRSFFRAVSPRRFPRLLDVACGTGRFCRAARSRGWDVTGIDVSETALNVASRISDAKFMKMSLDQAAGRMTGFDVVTAFELLEHLSNPRESLSRLMTMPRAGGLLFITVPCWDSPFVQKTASPEWMPPTHVQFFTRTSIKELLHRCQLGQVAVGKVRPSVAVLNLVAMLRAVLARFRPPLGLYAMGIRP